MKTNNEALTLIQEVRAAFSTVPYPGDDNITSPPHEWDEGIAAYFRGTTQEGHSVKDLRAHVEALSFFSPEAYHYYLPAFILADLIDPITADTISTSLLADFNSKKRTKEIIPRLSRAQRRVLIQYFRYYLEEYGESIDNGVIKAIQRLASVDTTPRIV